MLRIVGLDLSLTSTGAARIDVETAPLTTGLDPRTMAATRLARIQTKPVGNHIDVRSRRLRGIAGQLFELCDDADLIALEGPSYGSTGGAQHDRAGLWWLVAARLTGHGFDVVEIPPSVVKTYATGKGNTTKDAVLAAVVRRYSWLDVDGNDVADALLLAAMGARALGHPIEPDLPQTHLRAMATPSWPQPKETPQDA